MTESNNSTVIGFTGTQKGMTAEQADVVSNILSGRAGWFHHGDCVGADAQAHDIAKARGYLLAGHPPSNPAKRAHCKGFDRLFPEKDYIQRNHDIVDVTDGLIAAPAQFQEELRSGTWATVRYARRQGKPIVIVWPDGRKSLFAFEAREDGQVGAAEEFDRQAAEYAMQLKSMGFGP